MSQCINTYCLHKTQQTAQQICEKCGCSLVINERLTATDILSHTSNPFASPRTQTFNAIDLESGEEIILRVVHSNENKLTRPLKDAVIAMRKIHALDRHPGIMHLAKEEGYFTWQIRPDEPESHCMVTQKVPGVTLQKWIESFGSVSELLAKQWLQQVLVSIKALHFEGFVHRDIKPDNIIVTSDSAADFQQLVLIDFDAIWRIDSTSGSASTIGTPEYMAPEQAEGEPRPTSDLYSVGRMMTELLTTKTPSAVFKKTSGEVDWRRENVSISKPFASLIHRLSSKNTLDRPFNTDEVLDYLGKIESINSAKRKNTRRKLSIAVASLAVLAFSIFIPIRIGMNSGAILFSQTQSEASRLRAEGNQLILKGATEEGLVLIEQAVDLEPDSADLRSSLAIAQAFLGEYASAIESYEIVLEMEPSNPYDLYNLANIYESVDVEKAIRYYIESAEVKSPIRLRAIGNLARLHLLDGEPEQAEEVLDKVTSEEIDREDPQTRMATLKNLGWLSYQKGDFDNAKSQLAQAIDADPTQPDAYCLLALIQKESGEDNFSNKITCLNLRELIAKPELDKWKGILIEDGN